MKAISLIFRKLSQADFKNISGQGGVEGGGGQGYIDISTKGVTKEMMYDFLGTETSMVAKGPRWEFTVKSLSMDNEGQTVAIYQRRETSFCIASQKVGTRESNRIEVWKTDNTKFPDTQYDETNNPIVIFILKTIENEYWAGWFYLKEGEKFKMNSATAMMFAKDDGYIKFDPSVEINSKDYKWPFIFNFPSNTIHYSKNNNNMSKSDVFLTALRTKPFMLLAGISGTGKSRIVRKLAQASTTQKYENTEDRWKDNRPENFELIQVKPNWHNSMDVVGYYSNVAKRYEFPPFIDFIVKAWQDLETPYFLCLDEMNLAPVEQYFAEFLSAIESRSFDADGNYVTDPIIKPFKKFGEKEGKAMLVQLFGVPDPIDKNPLALQFFEKGLTLPKNLLVMGTVNMDETTFSFSRKVLDRAMSVVMNEVDYEGFFDGNTENDVAEMDEATRNLLINRPIRGLEADNNEADTVKEYLTNINKVLEDTPFKLGYRAANEALLYVSAAHKFNPDADIHVALDEFTMMKILSRIEGDKRSIGELLDENHLQAVITDVYPKSHEKLVKMAKTLKNQQFVSYWT